MDARGNPTTVSELFPSQWLQAADLGGRPVRVVIERVDFEELRQRDGTRERKAIVTFEKAHKRLILNKTQAHAILTIAGSERFADWPGVAVVLTEGRAPNGRPTITIERG